MDIYIIICFFAVFAALVEFACINFIDTFIKRFKTWEEEEKKRLDKEKEEKRCHLATLDEEHNNQDAEDEEDMKEVVKPDELFDELVVVHPTNGKESVQFNFKADAADMFFIDHR